MVHRLFADEDGQNTAEYALFMFLIAIASLAIMLVLGIKLKNYYSSSNTKVISTR